MSLYEEQSSYSWTASGKGIFNEYEENSIKLIDSTQRPVLKVPLSNNRTFEINSSASKVKCFSSSCVDDEWWKWHYRYSHLNFKSLNQLETKQW